MKTGRVLEKSPIILALDTATESCSAACMMGDHLYQRSAMDPQGHSRLLLPMIEEVLREADISKNALDAVAYDAGPGSFTGIRIGAGVAQGIALALNKPMLAISSLMTLAEGIRDQIKPSDRIVAAIDARMEQVYWGCLERDDGASGGWRWQEEPRVSDPESLKEHVSDCVGVGSGWDRYGSVFQADADCVWHPGAFPQAGYGARIASRLLNQGAKGEWREAAPAYIRNDVTN
ncbi:MAG TPA: tRNA (adenosine(37)-N6)-threonylcarbamoyltransferase complex dimerization subunit type 1 TsaB [Gammaproteobacteria bacterium]|nr:tRNA (adenosine(37)-N6)-threonylcarbamoyltransferase complex dimerization subunit type 1 TsaB [Gammaproteobacteria bacterium]